jgi:transposase
VAAGRPTKYRKKFCQTAIDTLAQGYSIAGVCADIGISRDTLYRWMKEHPEFSDSIKKGKELGQKKFETILLAKLSGKQIKDFDPKKSDTACLIFALKTRFHKEYGNKDHLTIAPEIENNKDTGFTLAYDTKPRQLPEKINDDEGDVIDV